MYAVGSYLWRANGNRSIEAKSELKRWNNKRRTEIAREIAPITHPPPAPDDHGNHVRYDRDPPANVNIKCMRPCPRPLKRATMGIQFVDLDNNNIGKLFKNDVLNTRKPENLHEIHKGTPLFILYKSMSRYYYGEINHEDINIRVVYCKPYNNRNKMFWEVERHFSTIGEVEEGIENITKRDGKICVCNKGGCQGLETCEFITLAVDINPELVEGHIPLFISRDYLRKKTIIKMSNDRKGENNLTLLGEKINNGEVMHLRTSRTTTMQTVIRFEVSKCDKEDLRKMGIGKIRPDIYIDSKMGVPVGAKYW